MRVFFKIVNDWREADVDQASIIEQNITHDDLENPTAYVSENAYSLTLPRTSKNNILFGGFCHLDQRRASANEYTPTAPMDFVANSSDGSPLMQGTATISSITAKEYRLSLIGSLGMVFSKLLNAGWDTQRAAEDPTYHLMTDWLKYSKGVEYVNTGMVDINGNGVIEERTKYTTATNRLTKEQVLASWLIDRPIFNWSTMRATLELSPDSRLSETQAYIASIVGWAPTSQGQPDNFESTKWLNICRLFSEETLITGSYRTITEVLASIVDISEGAKEIEGVGDGLIEAQMGEYRSYYQRPYIYVYRLWQMFKNECYDITGYTLNVASNVLGENSPMQDAVYMLPPHPNTNQRISGRALSTTAQNTLTFATQTSDVRYQIPALANANIAHATVYYNGIKAQQIASAEYNAIVSLTPVDNTLNRVLDWFPENYGYLEITLSQNNTTLATRKYVLLPVCTDDHVNMDWYTDPNVAPSANTIFADIRAKIAQGYEVVAAEYSPSTQSVRFGVSGTIATQLSTQRNVRLSAKFQFANTYVPISNRGTALGAIGNVLVDVSLGDAVNMSVYKPMRSNQELSLEALFDGVTPFDVLLKWSKLQHLVWEVNDIAKTINVKRAADYYAGKAAEGIADISQCVAADTIEVAPLSWNSRSVEFNFAEDETAKDYQERYNRTYGSKRLITAASLNNENTQLLCTSEHDTIAPSVLTTEIAPMAAKLAARVPQLAYQESKGKPSAAANCFYYRQANTPVSASFLLSGWRDYVAITDDAADEIRDGVYCWHGVDDGLHATSIPTFDICDRPQAVALQFAPTRERYTPNIYPEAMAYLYETNWQNYTEEVYNPANKTITATAVIGRQLYEVLKYNPLCRIDNVIYLLCKLESWSEIDGRAKITLRQITDLNNLTT